MNELVVAKERQGSRRAVAVGAAGFLVGLCLGLAGCGAPPEEETEEQSHGLMACSACTKDTCDKSCEVDPGETSHCSVWGPACGEGFGENPGGKNPEKPRNPPGAGGGGSAPKQHCSAVGQRGCARSGNRVLVGQHTVSKCKTNWTWRGLKQECWSEVYDTYSWQKSSAQCEYCNCETEVVKRCNRGNLNGGNWGHRTCGTFGGGADRARCY